MDTITTADARLQLGLQPIPERPEGAFAPGESPAYDEFDTQKRLLESEGPSAVDWTLLIRACESILRDEAKDIKIAVFYALALFRRQNFAGLAVAATVIRDMVVHHWDTMLPPVRRAANRAPQLEWLAAKLGPMLPERPPSGAEGAALRTCKALFDEITARMAEQGVRPKLADLARPLEQLDAEIQRAGDVAVAAEARKREEEDAKAEAEARTREAAARTPPPEQPAAPPATPPAMAGAAAAGTATASNAASGSEVKVEQVSVAQGATPQQIDSALATSTQGLRSIAKALLEIRLSDPRPYQILRFALWAGLTQPPPSQNGKVSWPGTPADRIKALNDLVQAGRFQEAIPEIEKSLGAQLFWLDAHRLTATALSGLGADHADARRVVVESLASLLRRFPTLPDLSFQTGVPFADPMTRAWIASEVLAGGGDGGAARPPWDEAADEARRLAGGGKVADAAALFAQGRRQADGERARLMWELAQARFCTEIGNLAVAVPILEHLDDQIDARGLDAWEPDAAVEMTKLLLTSYQKVAAAVPPPPPGQPPQPKRPDDARQLRTAKLQGRLSRLAVGEALALMKA